MLRSALQDTHCSHSGMIQEDTVIGGGTECVQCSCACGLSEGHAALFPPPDHV